MSFSVKLLLPDHPQDKPPQRELQEDPLRNPPSLISSEQNSKVEELEELLDLESHSELWMITILEV
jgi:hypothetical protein